MDVKGGLCMKRQEICEKTGLTPKALRLYEEKGLIAPDKSGIHHKMRDYSQEDLDRLLIIATLRKAMFTMTEIKEMLDTPETIQEIFPQYLSWLREQRKQISALLAASEQVDLGSIQSAQDLTNQIKTAARNLPIPTSDIHFRFRHLDEMEALRPSFSSHAQLSDTTQYQRPLQGGYEDSRTYRQFVAATSKTKDDDLAVAFGMARDVQAEMGQRSEIVQDRYIKDPLWIKVLKVILDIAILGSVFAVYIGAVNGAVLPFSAAALRIVLQIAVSIWRYQKSSNGVTVKAWIIFALAILLFAAIPFALSHTTHRGNPNNAQLVIKDEGEHDRKDIAYAVQAIADTFHTEDDFLDASLDRIIFDAKQSDRIAAQYAAKLEMDPTNVLVLSSGWDVYGTGNPSHYGYIEDWLWYVGKMDGTWTVLDFGENDTERPYAASTDFVP